MTEDAWDDRTIYSTSELALFLGGSETSFTGMLLVLIQKADSGNKARLRLGFPREVMAYDNWQSMSPAPTFAQLREAMVAAESPRGNTAGVLPPPGP